MPNYNQEKSFTLNLVQGWNQIGNPYPFDIRWSDVKNQNQDAPVGNLKVFQPSSSGFAESEDLKVWSGGFVFADSAAQVEFPVTLGALPGGRKSAETEHSILGESEWIVRLKLTHGSGVNNMIGFGMHPEALYGKDRFDEITLPRFFNYLEMNTEHPEFFAPYFTRDIVPPSSEFTWQFGFNSNHTEKMARLEWDPQSFGNNSCVLLLEDISQGTWIDMKVTEFYQFNPRKSDQFNIIYAYDESFLTSQPTLLGLPYPNPATESISIPVVLRESEIIDLEVVDMTGRTVKNLNDGSVNSGLFTFIWNCENESSEKVFPGIYFIRFISGKRQQIKKIIVK